jgi:predicted nucleic acid-binding protein
MSAGPAPGATPETILCDTTFVSVTQAAGPLLPATWPAAIVGRLETAILAINVITLAQLRDGHIYGKWGPARRARAERIIGSYLLVPLDMPVVDRLADLRATCRRTGVTVPDHDLWIAATAIERGWPLVSCDAHFDRIPGVDHIRLPIP